jgi:flagellar L-ring protein precursor FlgH
MRKDNSSGAEFSGSYGGSGASGSLNADYDSASERSSNGETQYRSEREFLDKFTVMVIDTLPNGNLMVGGTRNVGLEGDYRKLVLTGIVRRADVQPDNTISSRLVYNLSLRYETVEGQGAERKFINQGWLGKKINKIWPF